MRSRDRRLSPLLAVLLLPQCITGKAVLGVFNAPGKPQPVAFATCEERIPDEVLELLADVYDTPGALARVDPARAPKAPAQLADATLCLRAASRLPGGSGKACLDCLFDGTGCPSPDASLGFAAPPPLESTDPVAWHAERDVHRLQEHLAALLISVNQHCLVNGQAEVSLGARERLIENFTLGLRDLLAYQARRDLRRAVDRPVVAWVLAGGSANGAFSAGAAWWLLQQHQACGPACARDRVDILGGASTGSLIATLVKKYFYGVETGSAAIRAQAFSLLTDNYTCTVNQELYCVQDTRLAQLLGAEGDAPRGLISFDGVRALLARNVPLGEVRAHPEQFASTVEFLEGRVAHVSSAEAASEVDWVRAIEASIVQPFLAEPVGEVRGQRGVWIDGGVRSGLPLSTPLRRGADRALVFVNTALDGVPKASLPNAAAVAFRALDLFSLQPIVGELASSELEVVLKRQQEKARCLSRLGYATSGARAVELEGRCSRSSAAPLSVEDPMPRLERDGALRCASAPSHTTLAGLDDAYASSWLFMPQTLPDFGDLAIGKADWSTLAAVGYQFEPNAMWNLFVLGALVAQQRCVELNDTLSWHLPAQCSERGAVVAALRTLRARFEANGCGKKTPQLRDCPN